MSLWGFRKKAQESAEIGRLFHLQYSRNPLLCQRMTVSG
jgi:hypothetical protein